MKSKVTLVFKHTRRAIGTNDNGPYDIVNVAARTSSDEWASIVLTPVEWDAFSSAFGAFDVVTVDADVAPNSRGKVGRDGKAYLEATPDWSTLSVVKHPILRSPLPNSKALADIAGAKAQQTQAVETSAVPH